MPPVTRASAQAHAAFHQRLLQHQQDLLRSRDNSLTFDSPEDQDRERRESFLRDRLLLFFGSDRDQQDLHAFRSDAGTIMDSLNLYSRPVKEDPTPEPDDDALYNVQADAREHAIYEAYHIYFLLRTRLNADLARDIMQRAEVYEIYRQKRQLKNVAMMQNNGPAPVFVGQAIKARVRLQRPVRKVVFRFESHDQGWASTPNGGSWTWFTAGVVPDAVLCQYHDIRLTGDSVLSFTHPDFQGQRSQQPRAPIHRGMLRPRRRPPSPEIPEETYAEINMPEYSKGHAINDVIEREQMIMRNPMASRDWETTAIEWTYDDEDPKKAEWVRSLQRGDHIVVRAWAQFPGWTNYVRCVSVAVHNAILA